MKAGDWIQLEAWRGNIPRAVFYLLSADYTSASAYRVMTDEFTGKLVVEQGFHLGLRYFELTTPTEEEIQALMLWRMKQ